jgi:hypothetical protein
VASLNRGRGFQKSDDGWVWLPALVLRRHSGPGPKANFRDPAWALSARAHAIGSDLRAWGRTAGNFTADPTDLEIVSAELRDLAAQADAVLAVLYEQRAEQKAQGAIAEAKREARISKQRAKSAAFFAASKAKKQSLQAAKVAAGLASPDPAENRLMGLVMARARKAAADAQRMQGRDEMAKAVDAFKAAMGVDAEAANE